MNIIILEDTASSEAGGAELSMRHYSEYLFSKNHNLHLVYAKEGNLVSDRNISDIYKTKTQISVLPVLAKSPVAYIKALLSLKSLCREQKIDLIVTHVIHGFPMLRMLKMFCRVKVAVFFKWIPNFPDVGKQAKWGLKTIDYAIGNSHYVADYWKKQGVKFETKIPVIADGVFRPVLYNKTMLPEATPGFLGKSAFKLLYIGRISSGKGVHLLFEAMAELVNEPVVLYVAGKFEPVKNAYHKQLADLMQNYRLSENICLLGFVDNTYIGDLINQVDLVVVPSISTEARPRVILEAMALGKMVIGSRNGGVPETFGKEFDFFLFEPNSVESLKKKVLYIEKNKPEVESEYRGLLIKKFNTEYDFHVTQSLLAASMEIE